MTFTAMYDCWHMDHFFFLDERVISTRRKFIRGKVVAVMEQNEVKVSIRPNEIHPSVIFF